MWGCKWKRPGKVYSKYKPHKEDTRGLFLLCGIKQASIILLDHGWVFVNHIKKAFYQVKDVSEELQTLVKGDTDFWNPTLKISSNIDVIIKEIEYNQFVMEYKAELYETMRLKRTYEYNTYKLYTLLWE